MLTPETIDNALREIDQEITSYSISPSSLVKFTTSSEDKLFRSFIDGVSGCYLKALPLLIKKLNLKHIVELGNREGVSTLCIWDGLSSDATFTTIDLVRDQRYCPPPMFKDSRVHFVYGDVCDLSIFGENIPTNIDFLFSDTIHYYAQINDEFEIYQHLLADTAVVAIDDIHINDKGLFFEKIKYPKWDLTPLYHFSGWGLFLYTRKKAVSREERIRKAIEASAQVWKRRHTEAEQRIASLRRWNPLALAKNGVKKIPLLYKALTSLYNTYYRYRYPKGKHY